MEGGPADKIDASPLNGVGDKEPHLGEGKNKHYFPQMSKKGLLPLLLVQKKKIRRRARRSIKRKARRNLRKR